MSFPIRLRHLIKNVTKNRIRPHTVIEGIHKPYDLRSALEIGFLHGVFGSHAMTSCSILKWLLRTFWQGMRRNCGTRVP